MIAQVVVAGFLVVTVATVNVSSGGVSKCAKK